MRRPSPQPSACHRREFARAQPRGPTCMASDETRVACRRRVYPTRMAVRQLSDRHDAMVMRLALATHERVPSSRICASAAAGPSMHGFRRDALCVVLPSDTMRVATGPFSNRHDAMVMHWPSPRRRAPSTRVCASAAAGPNMLVLRRDAATAQDCTLETLGGGTTRCARLALNVSTGAVACTRAPTTWAAEPSTRGAAQRRHAGAFQRQPKIARFQHAVRAAAHARF